MDYLLRYEVWLILALVLIIADVMLALDFILLSFGVGAAVAGVSLLVRDTVPLPYTEAWEGMVMFFAVFSLLILLPLRKFVWAKLGNDDTKDINNY